MPLCSLSTDPGFAGCWHHSPLFFLAGQERSSGNGKQRALQGPPVQRSVVQAELGREAEATWI